MTPIEALKTATLYAAHVLERDDIGHITKGAKADVVVLNSDPGWPKCIYAE